MPLFPLDLMIWTLVTPLPLLSALKRGILVQKAFKPTKSLMRMVLAQAIRITFLALIAMTLLLLMTITMTEPTPESEGGDDKALLLQVLMWR